MKSRFKKLIKLRMKLKHELLRVKSYIARPRLVVQTSPVVVSELSYCDNPIFILGVHRSGTSLLRRIIDSHSHVACPPETYFLRHFISMVRDENTYAGFAGLGFNDRQLALAQIRRWATEYHEIFRASKGKLRWADKTPQYIDILSDINVILGKGVQFIFIFRHPLDVIHSIFSRGWRLGDYHPDLLTNTAMYVTEALSKELKFLKDNDEMCFKLHYEELVSEPEKILRQIFQFLGEPWEPEVLSYHKFEHNYGTEDPIVRGTTGFITNSHNWQSFTEEEMSRILPIVSDVMSDLCYCLEHPMPVAK